MMTERQIQAMLAALEFYANRDNWRSGVNHLDLTRLDPEYVPASMTGKENSGIVGGWEVAEHALRGTDPQPDLLPVLGKLPKPSAKDEPDEPGVYSIRNSIGCEVDRVTADSGNDALVDYAIKTGVTSDRLREIGYRAERDADGR